MTPEFVLINLPGFQGKYEIVAFQDRHSFDLFKEAAERKSLSYRSVEPWIASLLALEHGGFGAGCYTTGGREGPVSLVLEAQAGDRWLHVMAKVVGWAHMPEGVVRTKPINLDEIVTIVSPKIPV